MKVLIIVAILVACASAHKLDKYIPSFTTGYIINGEDAEPHSAPYLVSLSETFSAHVHSCGGNIISKDWILTAAHCLYGDPVGMGVFAGLHKRANFDTRTQGREVDFARIHELYIDAAGPYDIALLHVNRPFDFNEWVQPVALPERDEIHSGVTHLYGWGQPKAYPFAAAETLQTVETTIVEWDSCKEALPDDAPLDETNVCSDSLQNGIASCNGDSGGPLVIESAGAPAELVGIVSWGYIPCGYFNYPSMYTRVSAFIDWIEETQNDF